MYLAYIRVTSIPYGSKRYEPPQYKIVEFSHKPNTTQPNESYILIDG